MSEMQRNKGKLRKVDRFENESINDLCIRLVGDDIPDYCDNAFEYLEYEYDEKYIVYHNDIYEFVELKEIDYEESVFEAHKNDDGIIDFHVMFYNGGCLLSEAIECAIDNMEEIK